jgi:hypothetical protein
MKLLSKRVNTIEKGLVLANKTRGTLGSPNVVIIAPGDDVLECSGSGLVRRRGHGLGSCVDIYGEILGKI